MVAVSTDREMADEATMVQAWYTPTSVSLGIGEEVTRFRVTLDSGV